MTIVDYFDPHNVKHLKAWRKLEETARPGRWATDFEALIGPVPLEHQYWPEDWGPLIIAKMANAYLEEKIPRRTWLNPGPSEPPGGIGA